MRHRASKPVPPPAPVTKCVGKGAPVESTPNRRPWHSAVILIVGILLGKFHTRIVLHLNTIVHQIRPQCELGQICAWYEKRPHLQDGRLSSALWDVPRKHLTSNYSAIHLLRRGVRVNAQSQDPRVIWISSVLDQNEVQLLTNEAELALAEGRFGVNEVQQTVMHIYQMQKPVAQLLGNIVRLIGLPSTRYVEEVVFRRYNQHTQIDSQTPWCHNGQAATTAELFERCGCAAIAQLTLMSPEHGGTHVISGNTTQGHHTNEMLVTAQVGDVLTWFITHPMTETAQRILHHIEPVQQGTKLVAELHIRECSWRKHKRHTEREQLSSFRQESHDGSDAEGSDE